MKERRKRQSLQLQITNGPDASVSFPGRLPARLGPLVVIVCGGSSVDMQQLANLKVKLQT